MPDKAVARSHDRVPHDAYIDVVARGNDVDVGRSRKLTEDGLNFGAAHGWPVDRVDEDDHLVLTAGGKLFGDRFRVL